MARAKRRRRASARRRRKPISPPKRKTCQDCRRRVRIEKMKRQARARVAAICRNCDARLARKRYWADVEVSRRRRRESHWRHIEANRARSRKNACTPRGRAINLLAVRRWQARNPHKAGASRAVQRAVKAGRIKRPDRCEVRRCTRRAVHSHHNDYDKPLVVAWVCAQHHERAHHEGPQALRKIAAVRYAQMPQTLGS